MSNLNMDRILKMFGDATEERQNHGNVYIGQVVIGDVVNVGLPPEKARLSVDDIERLYKTFTHSKNRS